jgi:hypothetical protein
MTDVDQATSSPDDTTEPWATAPPLHARTDRLGPTTARDGDDATRST